MTRQLAQARGACDAAVRAAPGSDSTFVARNMTAICAPQNVTSQAAATATLAAAYE